MTWLCTLLLIQLLIAIQLYYEPVLIAYCAFSHVALHFLFRIITVHW